MSGTTGLGGLLATRLDAVMGTTLAKHPVVLDAKPGHNVAQAAQNIHGQDTTIRRAAEQVGARTGQADARQLGVRGGATAQGGPGTAPATATQNPFASARTLLSEPAQTILALLLGNMQGKAALQGRFPLLPLPPAPAAPGPGQGRAAGAQAGQAGAAAGGAAGAGTAAGTATGGNAAAAGGAASTAASGAGTAAGTAAAGARPGAGAPLPGTVATTLPAAPPGMAPAMAAALQQTVNQSGLFYESHLAQMAFGKRDAAEVLREPQARLPQAGASSAQGGNPAGPANANAAANPGAGTAAGAGQAAGTPGAAASGMAAATAGAAAAGGAWNASAASPAAGGSSVNLSLAANASQAGSTALAGIHPDAIPLVRQQLEALANQAFQWQGQAWDGANMNWEIQRREPEEGQSEAVATWATRLNLELPRLGNVEARLSLADNRLVLRLVAPSSAPLLQEHLNVLRERLLSQGLQLTDTAISSAALTPGAAETGVATAANVAASSAAAATAPASGSSHAGANAKAGMASTTTTTTTRPA